MGPSATSVIEGTPREIIEGAIVKIALARSFLRVPRSSPEFSHVIPVRFRSEGETLAVEVIPPYLHTFLQWLTTYGPKYFAG